MHLKKEIGTGCPVDGLGQDVQATITFGADNGHQMPDAGNLKNARQRQAVISAFNFPLFHRRFDDLTDRFFEAHGDVPGGVVAAHLGQI